AWLGAPRGSSTAPSLTSAGRIVPSALLRCVGAVVLGDFAADDLAVERQRLQHDIEPVAVLVREGEADVEPVVVLAFAPDNRVDAMRRFGCLSLSAIGTLHVERLRCPA